MQGYRADRAVKALAVLTTIAYYAVWVGTIAVLIATPAIRLLAARDLDWTFQLALPLTITSAHVIDTRWGEAILMIDDVRGDVRLPIGVLPWWFVGLIMVYAASMCALLLAGLHHLRRLFQRAREGAPFDPRNATRLRAIGILLFVFAVFDGVTGFIISLIVRRGLASASIPASAGLHVDGRVLLIALLLLALAEIFRRGAQLEEEQSLVV